MECPEDEQCFAQAGCKGLIGDPASASKVEEPGVSLSPDATPSPTIEYIEPTMSPLEADDYRNFFFCGTSWMDASTRCHKKCLSSLHEDCPAGEECFAQADCKNGVESQAPTVEPTPMPFEGTRSPTVSPMPTNSPTEPQPSGSPVIQPTQSPVLEPSDAPTTPFPSPRPTFAVRMYISNVHLCFYIRICFANISSHISNIAMCW